jgi:hypothetical protein
MLALVYEPILPRIAWVFQSLLSRLTGLWTSRHAAAMHKGCFGCFLLIPVGWPFLPVDAVGGIQAEVAVGCLRRSEA